MATGDVEGIDVDFDTADWLNASSGSNVAAALTVGTSTKANGSGNALVLTPTANGVGAVMRAAAAMAEGASWCARIAVKHVAAAPSTTLTYEAWLALFAAQAGDSKWAGVGVICGNANVFNSRTLGTYANTSTDSIVTKTAVSTIATTLIGNAVLDLRLQRSGNDLVGYLRVLGGPWLPMGTITGGYTATASGAQVGFRVQLNSGQATEVEVLALKYLTLAEMP